MNGQLLAIKISMDGDVALSRQCARDVAALLRYDSQDQTRIATAVSEAVRATVGLVRSSEVTFAVRDEDGHQMFEIRIHLPKTEAAKVHALLASSTESNHVLASGLLAAKRLGDQFTVAEAPGGATVVALGKFLPSAQRVSEQDVERIAQEMDRLRPRDPLEEVGRQNQELVSVLEALSQRQEELITVNRELEDTNRGVLALYSELEQRSEDLKRVSKLKSQFISEMSHEFRTPINSILSLSQILLDHLDGDLTAEQETQVGFIKKSAQDLSDLVDDLLDLAKIESGRVDVEPGEFKIVDLFGALRGLLRPLGQADEVQLIFENASGAPTMFTDEGKVSQILRNLISNAIKFTDKGEIRVSATTDLDDGTVTFVVSDTGIGIRAEDMERIFDEFVQAKVPGNRKVKGTGLGLPLSRKLAELLGGTIRCESEFGKGSTFYATLPILLGEETPESTDQVPQDFPERHHHMVLVIEDDPDILSICQRQLQGSGFEVVAAETLSAARMFLEKTRPTAIILNTLPPDGKKSWDFLADIKSQAGTKDVPVLVLTAGGELDRAMFLGADEICVKPIQTKWLPTALTKLAALERLLIIDDDEASRYLIKGMLTETRYSIIEAADGEEGLARARSDKPQVILLDLVMPGMTGFEVLRRLKEDPETREIPVVIITSKSLDESERDLLSQSAVDIVSKEGGTRQEVMNRIAEALETAEDRSEI